jgi:ribosomal protein S19
MQRKKVFIAKIVPAREKNIILKRRSETIKMLHVNKKFFTHDGYTYKRISVSALMVGHKYGEFVRTKKTTSKK